MLDALCAGEGTEEQALRVVEAFLDERGELPAEVLHTLMMVVVGDGDIEKSALRARADWFRKRGMRVPKMPKPPVELE